MTSSTAVLPLFAQDTTQQAADDRGASPRPGLAAAAARLQIIRSTHVVDGEQPTQLLLVIDCPFCDHQHIHPGGTLAAPRVCPRRARCVGRPGGTYYFPVVRQ